VGPGDGKRAGQQAPAPISQAICGIRIRIQIVGRSAESGGHVRPVRVQSDKASSPELMFHSRRARRAILIRRVADRPCASE